jgi:hypothetical protein
MYSEKQMAYCMFRQTKEEGGGEEGGNVKGIRPIVGKAGHDTKINSQIRRCISSYIYSPDAIILLPKQRYVFVEKAIEKKKKNLFPAFGLKRSSRRVRTKVLCC